MARRSRKSLWPRSLQSLVNSLARTAVREGGKALARSLKPTPAAKATRKSAAATRRSKPTSGSTRRPFESEGDWLSGVAMAPMGARRYHLFKPLGVQATERLPLLLMLHGCGQDALAFALSTRMNQLAARQRFLVLYPEQDRLANPQGCWNWFSTRNPVADGEVGILMAALRQVIQLHPVDPNRVAIAGLSAGASMAALMVTRHPAAFKAVAMHSGVPPGAAESTLSALVAMGGHGRAQPLEGGIDWPDLLVIHGERDSVVAAGNGRAAVALWAEASGARAQASRRLQRGQRHPMTVTDFKQKGGRTVATLCAIDQLGHAWSGGQATQPHSDPKGPDASRLIWAFAAKRFGPV